MKLRIRGHSLRLRLERGEVEAFGARGRVEDRVRLTPTASLAYGLVADDVDEPQVDFDGAALRLRVPHAVARRWVESDEVGFGASLSRSGDDGGGDGVPEVLEVLVEKDFRCLHKRPGEDESDQYPHPAESGDG